MRGRRPVAAVAAVAALALSSCGVPEDDAPRAIDDAAVPFDLLAPTTTSTTATIPPVTEAAVEVFFVRGDLLEPVQRRVAAPPTGDRALVALVRGPTEAETAMGFRSAIAGTTPPPSVDVDARIATVELPPSFGDLTGQEQILAVAQIVFTLTDLVTVAAVRFSLGDEPIQVPTADGTLTGGPVARADFAALAPR